jgi:hypothetical protein
VADDSDLIFLDARGVVQQMIEQEPHIRYTIANPLLNARRTLFGSLAIGAREFWRDNLGVIHCRDDVAVTGQVNRKKCGLPAVSPAAV